MITVYDVLFLVGRLIFGLFWMKNGFDHLLNFKDMKGYARSKGVPIPGAAVILSGLMIIAGGFSILAGLYPVVGIILIGLFLIVISFFMHNYWALPKEQKMVQKVNFFKNMALFGATLMMLAIPVPWALSLM